MGISADEIIRQHPQLFHMAEVGTWDSIRNNGLLSTSALLDRYGTNGHERVEIEERNRRLTDMSVQEWYRVLNSQVYFWTSWERLMRLFNARAYRGKTQCIMTIDTESFLDRYSEKVALSPINSGSTIFKPQPRGSDTFLPLVDFPFDDWKAKRGSGKKAIVEITVKYSVPDIRDFVTDVVHMKNKKVTKRII
jgi:hypothetical protein